MKVFLTVWASVVGTLVLGATWWYYDADRQADAHRLAAQASALAADLQRDLAEHHQAELAWVANRPAVRAFLADLLPAPEALEARLHETEGLLGLAAIYLVDRTGQIRASSDPRLPGRSVADQPFFQAAQGGRPGFTLSLGLSDGVRGLSCSLPVFQAGRVVGAAVFQISAAQLDRALDLSPEAYLLGPGGAVFAHSPSARALVGPGDPGPGTRSVKVDLPSVPGACLMLVENASVAWRPLLVLDVMLILLSAVVYWLSRSWLTARRRRSEDRDRRQRESLLANLLEGIAVLDSDGRVTWGNPAFRRLAEWPEGTEAPTLAGLWERSGEEPWADVYQGRRTWVVFEAVLKGKAGAWTPVSAGLTVSDGRYLLSVLDRSEGHRSEQLLRHSQKLTVLGQLSAGIAHDLNNMLGVLLGMTDLLKMSLPEQDPLQESVDLMLTTLTRAGTLAEKMLDFARQTPMVRVPVDLAAVLRELRFLARTALTDPSSAEVVPPEGPVPVLGDENLLLSALLNLVLNASEALPPQGGRIRVWGEDAGGGRYRITVEDNGIGMDRETLGRVFEPFFSTKGGEKGTGLGLALVRRTVLEHRGTIDVRSAPGEGTTVAVTLPLAR